MFTLVFTVVKRWKQPKCPLTGKWVNSTWGIHITECYLALKKGFLTHAVTNNLNDTVLSKMSLSLKDKCYMIHSYEVPRVGKFTETN